MDTVRTVINELRPIVFALGCMLALRAWFLMMIVTFRSFAWWWCSHFEHDVVFTPSSRNAERYKEFNVCRRCHGWWTAETGWRPR